ncbi:MAG: SRPBCC family protein [Bacteroidaceae bacterium]
MAEYKSTVHVSPFPQQRVYDRLSDLTFLSLIQDSLDNQEARNRILEQAQGKVTAEQLDSAAEKIRQMQFDRDSVTSDTPVGKVTLRIVEREEPKCVKFALEGAPIQANLWIQMLPQGEQCAMRVTLKAELNFLIKQMVGKKLEEGTEGLARMLASIPY